MDSPLILKKGAQVMFIKNDPQKKYVNGSIGIVSSLSNDAIYVDLKQESGHTEKIKVEKTQWEAIKFT